MKNAPTLDGDYMAFSSVRRCKSLMMSVYTVGRLKSTSGTKNRKLKKLFYIYADKRYVLRGIFLVPNFIRCKES